MKIIQLTLISILLFASLQSFSQINKFEIRKGQIIPLVQSANGIKADSLYTRFLDWINYNFKRADAVVGSRVDDRMIRFVGVKPRFAKSIGHVYDLEFTIKSEFKDDRYKLTIENLRSGIGGVFGEFKLADYYKSDGEPRKAYADFVSGVETALNDLNVSIYKYLTKAESEGDW